MFLLLVFPPLISMGLFSEFSECPRHNNTIQQSDGPVAVTAPVTLVLFTHAALTMVTFIFCGIEKAAFKGGIKIDLTLTVSNPIIITTHRPEV